MMLVERHLDAGVQFSFFEGLQNVAERFRHLRTLQGGIVRIRREIDHGNVELAAHLVGRFDAVHVPLEPDVHQDKVRQGLRGLSDRLRSR